MIFPAELPPLQSDSVAEQPKPTGSLRVCLVTLGDETFAIDLRQVREVFEPESITPVPGMPAALVGVTNLRGTIIPLADVRTLLGVSASTRPKYAVVVRHGTRHIGLLVEDVPELRTVQLDDLIASLTRTAVETRPAFSGSFRIESKLSAILELSQLLASIEEPATGQRSIPSHEETIVPAMVGPIVRHEQEGSHGEV